MLSFGFQLAAYNKIATGVFSLGKFGSGIFGNEVAQKIIQETAKKSFLTSLADSDTALGFLARIVTNKYVVNTAISEAVTVGVPNAISWIKTGETLDAKTNLLLAAAGAITPLIKGRLDAATAAGDAFNGALTVALSEDRSLCDAARWANAAAAISVTRLGAQPSLPTRHEIDAFQE